MRKGVETPSFTGSNQSRYFFHAIFGLAEFRTHDVQTVATIPDDGVSLRSFRREKRCAVFMGSEAFGLPSELVRQIKSKVHIPMPKGVDSFSVNAAAAVVLYALQGGSQGEE